MLVKVFAIWTFFTFSVNVVFSQDFDKYEAWLDKSLKEGKISKEVYDATMSKLPQVKTFSKFRKKSRSLLFSLAKEDGVSLKSNTTAIPKLMPFEPSSMNAVLQKPYTTIVFNGKEFDIRNLKGGHNGSVAGACVTQRPIFNPITKKWEINVLNNLINFDFPTPLGLVKVTSFNEPGEPEGKVVSHSDELPVYPVDSTFSVRLRAEIGENIYVSPKPINLTSKNLTSWPPKKGSVYINVDTVEFIPEGADKETPSTFTIKPDLTIIEDVSTVKE